MRDLELYTQILGCMRAAREIALRDVPAAHLDGRSRAANGSIGCQCDGREQEGH